MLKWCSFRFLLGLGIDGIAHYLAKQLHVDVGLQFQQVSELIKGFEATMCLAVFHCLLRHDDGDAW